MLSFQLESNIKIINKILCVILNYLRNPAHASLPHISIQTSSAQQTHVTVAVTSGSTGSRFLFRWPTAHQYHMLLCLVISISSADCWRP